MAQRSRGRHRQSYQAAYYTANKEKIRDSQRAYYIANPEAQRRRSRVRLGIPEPTRPRPTLCEICGKPPHRIALGADHDHKTGKFRGWLCQRCNTGLGFFGDSLRNVLKIVKYLRRKQWPKDLPS